LVDADFRDTSVSGASFKKATITGANFSGSDISRADFSNAIDIPDAKFEGAFYGCDEPAKPIGLPDTVMRSLEKKC